MTRVFLSPAEQALLDGLPEGERAVVRGLFDELDAHLIEESNLNWMRDSRPPASAWWVEKEVA